MRTYNISSSLLRFDFGLLVVNVELELLKRPDGSGIELLDGLEHSDAPMCSSWFAGSGIELFEKIADIVDRAIITHQDPIQCTRSDITYIDRQSQFCMCFSLLFRTSVRSRVVGLK